MNFPTALLALPMPLKQITLNSYTAFLLQIYRAVLIQVPVSLDSVSISVLMPAMYSSLKFPLSIISIKDARENVYRDRR